MAEVKGLLSAKESELEKKDRELESAVREFFEYDNNFLCFSLRSIHSVFQLSENAAVSDMVKELQHELSKLRNDYESYKVVFSVLTEYWLFIEFQENAEMQFSVEVQQRDYTIELLRTRLAELEQYPGWYCWLLIISSINDKKFEIIY